MFSRFECFCLFDRRKRRISSQEEFSFLFFSIHGSVIDSNQSYSWRKLTEREILEFGAAEDCCCETESLLLEYLSKFEKKKTGKRCFFWFLSTRCLVTLSLFEMRGEVNFSGFFEQWISSYQSRNFLKFGTRGNDDPIWKFLGRAVFKLGFWYPFFLFASISLARNYAV